MWPATFLPKFCRSRLTPDLHRPQRHRQSAPSCNAHSDINVVETRALPSPAALLAELPKSESQAAFVAHSRQDIHRIIFTDDRRFLPLIGPCSIHDLEAGRDYARRLAVLSKKFPTVF